ncbi:putative phospholipase/Carboxylesterase [Lyophyllum shimeji]|uniref:Acyl-protein thioesterase 1 n=1 Tax=Lyophyllum shimeji TaxID=47721 RepID=A0A9P3ULE6_LYOSH|nr:putative phospholipase/Carboxylesterase [Lyophyllum shimeji]
MDDTPACEGIITIPAVQAHTATVIFIHGYNKSNLTYQALVAESIAPSLPHVQWIFPQASKHQTTYHPEGPCPAWFDIEELPPRADEYDEQAISKSIGAIEELIQSQIHQGMDSRRIVLAGFSQGAALSMMVALQTRHHLGGLASLSGWIPPRARSSMMNSTQRCPILWCHGTADTEIPIALAEDGIAFLRDTIEQKETLRFIRYDGLEHTTNDAELKDLGAWLQTVIR